MKIFNNGKRRKGYATIISKETEITGKLTVNNQLQVHGKITGGYVSENTNTHLDFLHSDGKTAILCSDMVFIAPTATVYGDIYADEAHIAGKVTGNVVVKGKLVIVKGSKLDGDVTSSAITLEEGAIFNGTVNIVSAELAPNKQLKKEVKTNIALEA